MNHLTPTSLCLGTRRITKVTTVLTFVLSMNNIQPAAAQAWVDTPGSLSVALDYNYGPASGIVGAGSETIAEAPTTQHTVIVGAEYTVIDKLALSVSLPIIAMHVDPNAQGPHGRYDDGDLHLSLQDLRLDARYALLEDIFALALGVGASTPASDYPTAGSGAIGRGLKALHFNVAAGRTLDPILPNLFFQARYEFSLFESYKTLAPETAAIDQNRSSFGAQLGYFFIEEFEVHAAIDGRYSHGGLEFEEWDAAPIAVQYFHDALLQESVLMVGGGTSYAISEAVSVNAIFRMFLGGANTRSAHFFGAGVSWSVL